MPEDIADILGTRAFQRYVDTPLQTLDGIIVNQPKHFLPLTKEAKRIAKEIRIERINEQWAGIPQEQLLNQSLNDQLNSIQILEQLAPLQLVKEHLPGDIVDILERLGKADNIPFNQLYYIAENCVDHYCSKVIETFVALLKCQFVDRQLLLVNTTRSLKFLEDYVDRQVLIWKIFQRHETIPDDIQDLHFYIDDFKSNIASNFRGSEHKGSVTSIQKFAEKTPECRTPASLHQDAQDVDWPDVIPVEVPPQPNQNIEQSIPTLPR